MLDKILKNQNFTIRELPSQASQSCKDLVGWSVRDPTIPDSESDQRKTNFVSVLKNNIIRQTGVSLDFEISWVLDRISLTSEVKKFSFGPQV